MIPVASTHLSITAREGIHRPATAASGQIQPSGGQRRRRLQTRPGNDTSVRPRVRAALGSFRPGSRGQAAGEDGYPRVAPRWRPAPTWGVPAA